MIKFDPSIFISRKLKEKMGKLNKTATPQTVKNLFIFYFVYFFHSIFCDYQKFYEIINLNVRHLLIYYFYFELVSANYLTIFTEDEQIFSRMPIQLI